MKIWLITFFILPLCIYAQDDIMNMLEKQETAKTKEFAVGVFKGNKIINAQSTEQPARNSWQFNISHRFGQMNGGVKEFFGLDNSTIRFCFEYGILDNLSVGAGRSSYQKIWDGYAKWRIIRQQTGKRNIPITISAYSSIAIRSDDWADPGRHNFFSSRLYYSSQLIISRKFGPWVSLQVMPTMVHRNLVATVRDRNDVFALGAAASVKLTKRMRFNIEYFYIIPGQIVSLDNGLKVRNNLSIGVDIETGGHIFQLHFTNSRGMIEKNFVAETTGNWFPSSFKDFGVQFGFNISRNFVIKPHKKHKTDKAAESTENKKPDLK